MARPHRPHRKAHRQIRPGWHHAPGRAEVPRRPRYPGFCHLWKRRERAPPAPLRGEQHLRAAARGEGLQGVRAHAEREPARDDGAAGPPVFRRRAVPPGVHFHTAQQPPALQGVRRRGPAPPGAREASAVGRRSMKLCGFDVGLDRPLFLIAGPCVVESRELQLEVAGRLKEMCRPLGVPFIFKSSYDKANRSSGKSFRGLGMDKGLQILSEVKRQLGVPLLTDVHTEEEVKPVAEVVDVLQTPAFLCRQTDFIHAAAASGRPVNIKKGQFLSPQEMKNVVDKAKEASKQENILVCERGFSFGYGNLVSDMRSLAIMRDTGCPVVFDATHSVQLPGGQGTASGGQREFIPVLARAAVATGIAGLFMETHPDPAKALSDGPNAWPLAMMPELLETLVELDRLVKQRGLAEHKVKQ